ncbi:protein PRRC2A-like [Apteryx mantelli]|uniref:Protein PRRC2A-like n=1 Tax=Apteryx mantelli TaxID=2696672 RepID=A0ABM4G706_9AVES
MGGTEMSQSDSGVDLSGDSQASSASCSQRSSPDGGLKAVAPPGGGQPGPPAPEGPQEQRRRLPPREPPALKDKKVCSPPGRPPRTPSAPSARSERTRPKPPRGPPRPLREGPARPTPGFPPPPPPPGGQRGARMPGPRRRVTPGAEQRRGERATRSSCRLPPPPAEGLDAGSRDWEPLTSGGPAQPHGGPEAPPARPAEPKGLAPPEPPGPGQRLYPELFYGGAGAVGQVPSGPVESQLGTSGSFRPGTPSLNPYRAGPVFVAGAGLPAVPLKGPFVEFPAVAGPELAKLGGAGGLLYPPAPPFVYSPPFCPDPPLLQVRQELTPPSDFYGQGGQSSFQQMLLPVVESPVAPVVNFGGPPGPPAPPLPLLPLGRLVAPPGRPFGPPGPPGGRPEARGGGRGRPAEAPPGAPPPPRGPLPRAAAPPPPPPPGPRRPPGAWGAPPPPRGLPPALEPPPGGRPPPRPQ